MLLTVVLFAGAVYRLVLVPAEDDLAAHDMRLASAGAAEQIRSLVRSVEDVTRTGRAWGAAGLLSIDEVEAVNRLMIPVIGNDPAITAMLFAREDAREILLYKTGNTWSNRTTDALKRPGEQLWVERDAGGRVVREERAQEPYDPRSRPWYQGAMAALDETTIHWTEPYRFFATKELALTASMRWTDRKTGLRHVLAYDVMLQDLSKFTSSITVGQRGTIAVLEGDGRLVGLPHDPGVKTDADRVGRLLRQPGEAGLAELAAGWALWRAGGRPILQPLHFESGGEAWIALIDSVTVGQRELLIATVAPRADFAIGKAWHLALCVMIFLVAFGLALLAARLEANRLALGLEALARESRRIGGLDLERPVQVEARSREMQALAQSQEDMRRALLEATRGLEAKVETRTRELAEREAYTRTLLESASSALILATTDGTIRHASARYSEISGYPNGEILALNAADQYVDAAGRAQFLEALERDGQVRNFEARFRRRDGTEFWGLLNASWVNLGGERLIATWLHDVTDLHNAAERLRSGNAQQEAILESASTGIAMYRQGVIVRCNRRLEEMFGYAPGELQGAPTRSLYATDEEYERVRAEHNAQLAAQGVTQRRELLKSRKDGSTFWCRTMGRAIGAGHQERGSVWAFEDVTVEREADEALRVAKRTAEDATHAKSMFLANMSHEIRTPMNAIIGLSHLALKTRLTARQRDYVAKIQGAGASLLALINDILDFSKVEAGKLDLESVPFRLDDVLEGVSSVLAQKAQDKGLELLFDVGPGVPQALVGDPLRLRQVMTNLISNAVKFTDHGQVTMTVNAGDPADGKVQLRVAVRDSGIGMSSEESGRLFRAFTQGDQSTTRKYGGTGLGLTICARLVEMMGGAFHVESAPGRGSTFSFTARFGVGDEGTLRRRSVPEALGGVRVLVVNDNESVRNVLVEMLRGFGFAADAAASGAEALHAVGAASAQPYGLVFVDGQLAGMSGIDTARGLLGMSDAPRVMMVTELGQDELRAEAERAGVEACLVKPLTSSSVIDALAGQFAPPLEVPPADDGERLDGARLLLAEDNEINQQIARELLEGAGAQVTIANNGREAVDMVLAAGPGAYHAVLMDLQMPELGGIDATRRIRGDGRFAALPIIAMTAEAMVEDRDRCLAAGMVDHITKPIDPQVLFRAIARQLYLSPAPAPRAAPAAASGDPPLPDVAGLDSAMGLRRAGGNRALYADLLRQFADTQADSCARIVEALGAKDPAAAERIAHTVRGVAGNLGLDALRARATDLEAALRAREDEQPALAACEAELARAVAALGAALGTKAVAASTAALDASGVQRLAAMLEQFDGGVLEYFLDNAGALRALCGDAEFATLSDAVTRYDFKAALSILEASAARSGIRIAENVA